MTWPEIWYGKTLDSRVIRYALVPASWLYAVGWSLYRLVYDIGLKPAKSPYHPVLCVGNLTVGGSGKTPLTVLIARALSEAGVPVAVSCSGYGSPRAEGATLAPKGPIDAALWGDEPTLLREMLPDTPLIVGRARVHAAKVAHELAQANPGLVLILDDGFQHLPLKKSVTVLVDPPSENHFCLPAGPYREPRSNLRRATIVLGPSDSPYQLVSEITGFSALDGQPVRVPGEADALCAIGRPESFFSALRRIGGLTLKRSVALPDHDDMAGSLAKVEDPVIVTAKDAVKLRMLSEARGRNIIVAQHRVSIEPMTAFMKELMERLSK